MNASDAVTWLARSPMTTAVFTDFDGTLSAVVARAEDARPLPGVPELLKRLAAKLGYVGVVSGRQVAWLVDQLALSGQVGTAGLAGRGIVHAAGLHGLERSTGDSVQLAEGVTDWLPTIRRARDQARAQAPAGVDVEDKGYGVTLHWRQIADREGIAEAVAGLAQRLAASTGLAARAGKASMELVLPIGIDKGSVVREWSAGRGLERVGFLGDDVSDLSAFAAVRELAAGLKIAVASAEMPSELVDQADVVLAGPEEAVALLTELADRL
ncbi:MAG TPA: trehalose-phosphatase [Acidimicrobiales bacterium]|nr:trehalose-phosphatase [Acidimicrobiales bacterium]